MLHWPVWAFSTIRAADRLSSPDSSLASKRSYLRPVISASLRIDSRPPGFTPDDNADIIQHPTFIQIRDQCVDGLIQLEP